VVSCEREPPSFFKLLLALIRGNVHGSSMARWKARGRLPISANLTFLPAFTVDEL